MLYFRDISTLLLPEPRVPRPQPRRRRLPAVEPGGGCGHAVPARLPGGRPARRRRRRPASRSPSALPCTCCSPPPARRRSGASSGMSRLAAWTCGLVFALSGFMVSAVNLMEKHQAAAWAPIVLLAALRCARRPRPRRSRAARRRRWPCRSRRWRARSSCRPRPPPLVLLVAAARPPGPDRARRSAALWPRCCPRPRCSGAAAVHRRTRGAARGSPRPRRCPDRVAPRARRHPAAAVLRRHAHLQRRRASGARTSSRRLPVPAEPLPRAPPSSRWPPPPDATGSGCWSPAALLLALGAHGPFAPVLGHARRCSARR